MNQIDSDYEGEVEAKEVIEFTEEDYRILYTAVGKIPVALDDPSYPKMVALREKIFIKNKALNQ